MIGKQQQVQVLKQNDPLSSKRSSVSSVNSATALHGVSEGRSLFFSANNPTIVQPQLLLTASYNPQQGLLSSSYNPYKKQPPPPPQNPSPTPVVPQNTAHSNGSISNVQSSHNYSNSNLLNSSLNNSSHNFFSSAGTRESNASSLVPLYNKSPTSTFQSVSEDDFRKSSIHHNPSIHSTTPLPPVDEDEKFPSLGRKKIFGWPGKKESSPSHSTDASPEPTRASPSPKHKEYKDYLNKQQQNQKALADKVLDQVKNIGKPVPTTPTSIQNANNHVPHALGISGKITQQSVGYEYDSESNDNSVNVYLDTFVTSSSQSSPEVPNVPQKNSDASKSREETILPSREKTIPPRRIVSLEEFEKSTNVTRPKGSRSKVLPAPPNDTVIPKTPPQFSVASATQNQPSYNPYPPAQEPFFTDKWNVNIPQRSTSLGRNSSFSSIRKGYREEMESPPPPVPPVPEHLLHQLQQVHHSKSNSNLQQPQTEQTYNSKDRAGNNEQKVTSLDRNQSSKFPSMDRVHRFDSNGRKKDPSERGKRMQSLDRLKKTIERTFFDSDHKDTSATSMTRQDSRDGKKGLASVWNGWKRKDETPQNPHPAVEPFVAPRTRNPSMPNLKDREKSKSRNNGDNNVDTGPYGSGSKGTVSLGRSREKSDLQDEFDEMEKKRGIGKSTFGTLSLGRSRGRSRGEQEMRDLHDLKDVDQNVIPIVINSSLPRDGRESRESMNRNKDLKSPRSTEKIEVDGYSSKKEFEGLPQLTTEFGLDFKDMLRIFDK